MEAMGIYMEEVGVSLPCKSCKIRKLGKCFAPVWFCQAAGMHLEENAGRVNWMEQVPGSLAARVHGVSGGKGGCACVCVPACAPCHKHVVSSLVVLCTAVGIPPQQ